jgi:hypothetical protein
MSLGPARQDRRVAAVPAETGTSIPTRPASARADAPHLPCLA